MSRCATRTEIDLERYVDVVILIASLIYLLDNEYNSGADSV